MEKVALFTDELMIKHPSALGLREENLESQAWLKVYTKAKEARSDLRGRSDIEEVWITPNGEMDPVNLAAAFKKDTPSRKVYLLADDLSDSYRGRAARAGVEAVLGQSHLARVYQQRKRAESPSQPESISVAQLCGGSVLPAFSVKQKADDPPLDALTEALSASVQGRDAGNRTLVPAEQDGRSKGFVLPIVAGSGGCGKSTVACLLALIAQQAGINTVLLDFDLQFGDCKELLGYESALPIDEALSLPQRMNQSRPKPEKPALVMPPDRMEHVEKLQGRVVELLEAARSSFDLVIVNTGSFWADHHIALLERCDRAIFILDQRPSSLRGCKRALDLCTRCGVAASPFVFVVNRCSKNALYSSLDVSSAFHGAQTIELRDGGVDVEDLMAAAQPESIIHMHNAFALSLESLLGKLVPAAAEAGVGKSAPDGRGGLLASFLKR